MHLEIPVTYTYNPENTATLKLNVEERYSPDSAEIQTLDPLIKRVLLVMTLKGVIWRDRQ